MSCEQGGPGWNDKARLRWHRGSYGWGPDLVEPPARWGLGGRSPPEIFRQIGLILSAKKEFQLWNSPCFENNFSTSIMKITAVFNFLNTISSFTFQKAFFHRLGTWNSTGIMHPSEAHRALARPQYHRRRRFGRRDARRRRIFCKKGFFNHIFHASEHQIIFKKISTRNEIFLWIGV